MIFINPNMFTGELYIPNLNEKCIKDYEILILFSKWEKEALELVLGICMMDALIQQIEVKESEEGKHYGLKDDADDKWKWLVNGRTYEKTDESVSNFLDLSEFGCGCGCGNISGCPKHYWDGFVTETNLIVDEAETAYKQSFLADYVYFMWAFYNESKTTQSGEQKTVVKNSVSVTNKTKRVDAFNNFYAKVRMCNTGGRVGLHGFIKEHKDLYPDFMENNIKPLNYWDV